MFRRVLPIKIIEKRKGEGIRKDLREYRFNMVMGGIVAPKDAFKKGDTVNVIVEDKNWYRETPDFIWIKEKIPLLERIKNFFKGNSFRKYRRRKVPFLKEFKERGKRDDSVIINFS